jgi:hypothetical protein
MKKFLSTSVCAMAITGAALAQGSVSWSVISPAAFTAETNTTAYSSFAASTGNPVGGSVGLTGTSANSFYYALLYTSYSGTQAAAPTTVSQLSTWTYSGLSAVNSASAGKASPVNGSTQVTVPWAAGTTDSIVLVGWSADLGTTYAAALANLGNWTAYSATLDGALAYFGVSTTGYLSPNSANPGVSVFGASATPAGLPINSLNTQLNELYVPVPEPGTMALAGLGGLSLLAFRRKK